MVEGHSAASRQRYPDAERRLGEWDVILHALQEVSGFTRGVLYDVPRSAAPRRISGSPVFLRGTPEWQRYVAARRACDDGMLTPILSLRALDDEERLLVVDWGSAHSNMFLLIEPREGERDLTDPADPVRRSLFAAARSALPELERGESERRPAFAAVCDLLRAVYGVWVFWTWTPYARHMHLVDLPRLSPADTIAGVLLPRLRALFPQDSFDHSLLDLHEREPELFGGPVTRARMPFRTRLGLPVLYDPRCADRAVRRLVNEGNAHAYWYSPERVARYGPGRPIPDEMSDEEFERLRM